MKLRRRSQERKNPMQLTDALLLMGGLALFLYGMHIMGEGLEVAAGSKLKGLLEKLTKNRFLGCWWAW